MRRLLLALLALLFCLRTAAVPLADFIVTDYGAAPGGADCTGAFQQALDAAFRAGGGSVFVPSGEYTLRGTLKIRSGVYLTGTHQAPPTQRNDHQAEQRRTCSGSALRVYAGKNEPDSDPFITLEGSNCGVKGLIISYPEWSQETVPPIPYPPCIAGCVGDNQSVIDCLLLNPYEGIRLSGVGRSYVRNVYGYPIKRGLYIDKCYDISRVENCHFWPFGVRYDQTEKYCQWINKNGTAFEFARSDWQYVTNCFCFGYGAGYRFSASDAGSCNGNFLGLGADCCTNSVLVEACQGPGLLITNGEFVGRWSSDDSCPVNILETAAGKVSLLNCSFWGPIDTSIRTASPDGLLSVMGCHFESWEKAAIEMNGGNGLIQGNTFNEKTPQIILGEKTRSAIITGNLAEGEIIVDNRIGSKAQISRNSRAFAVKMTEEQKKNYVIDVGAPNESMYFRNFYKGEAAGEFSGGGTKRWSQKNESIIIPVNRHTRCAVTVDLYVPRAAVREDMGIYLDGVNVMPVTGAGEHRVSCEIDTGDRSSLTLKPRFAYWNPRELSGSADDRWIGIGLREIRVISDPRARVFSANRLEYTDE
ncbi:MAG: hypothetical protein IK083_10265 [Abditibacteriota bacterium]|nr:hypothetical protein [Abditibacteriota bacterium]